ncbi:MAG TPA: LysR family transcriptional regulator [Leptolyngbyaceae cyanobacterium M33_DOE_097]|uniref:LysR family transcriptional regulator n=1 Tax=Oscillatoriales cyanobacterium SpSt-418 TaxID=2282169 RepID=A0A7C3PDI7_9CYAN|nr:LysR family transcriptional regulator [Leptolyngbyaceae cyanobacterium M33_DOE_097]
MKSINLSSVDLNLLVAFEALFEEKSVTAAAQRLHLGQPAMSAALSRLRLLFQDELFIRIGREMQPTAKALEIAPNLSLALQQIRATLATSQTFDPATSEQAFAIASSDYTSTVLIPKLLEHCRHFAPGVDLRLLTFTKNQLETLLEQRTIEIAIGTFQETPRQALQVPLMQERFVGICRHGHPALRDGEMTLNAFVETPQALFTLRQDAIGEVDKVLAEKGLKRRIALTTPYLLVLPTIIANSDLVAAIPSRIAKQFAEQGHIDWFELPIHTEPWFISMMWSKLSDQDTANVWLRETIQQVCPV